MSRTAPEILILQRGALRSISLRTMASNVPQAPATEEAQGSQEASVDCVAFFLTDWWNNAHLSLAFVPGGSIQQSSTQLWKCLHRAIEQKKIPSGACAPLCHADFILACRPKFLFLIWSMIQSVIRPMIWSGPIQILSTPLSRATFSVFKIAYLWRCWPRLSQLHISYLDK